MTIFIWLLILLVFKYVLLCNVPNWVFVIWCVVAGFYTLGNIIVCDDRE